MVRQNPDYNMCSRCYEKFPPDELKKHKLAKGLVCGNCRVALDIELKESKR